LRGVRDDADVYRVGAPDLGAVDVDLDEATVVVGQNLAAARAEEETGSDAEKDYDVRLLVTGRGEKGEVVGCAGAEGVGEG